jgi:hypothetical protein
MPPPPGDADAPPIQEERTSKREASQATKAFKMATKAGAEAWIDDSGTPHVTVPMEDHVEHYRLKPDPDSPAGRWLARLYYRKVGAALPAGAKKDALENLIAEAVSADRIHPTSRRIARHGQQVFLDLCTPSWEVVEVSPQGWTVRPASEVPIRFTRAPAMLALPLPVAGGRVDALRPFFNCEETDFHLVVVWILAALSGGREYPILVFQGEAGSAKSTATNFARAVVDPNKAPLRKTPKEERDLFIAANNSLVLTMDNLSAPPDWLPDALCAVALDAGYACRAMYKDDEESIFRVAAPIILNGISEQLTRSDLADRALSVTLHRLSPEQMRPKDELDAAFRAALPSVLGAFLTVLASALARLPEIHLAQYPRMAQTAKLMAAAEPALGWPKGTFAQLFNLAQEAVAANAMEGEPIAGALEELRSRQHKHPSLGKAGEFAFQGSATELQALLQSVKPTPMPAVWPPAPNKISERIRRLAPQLRLMGWHVDPDGRDGSRKNGRFLEICYPRTIQAVRPSGCGYAPGLGSDGSDGSDGSPGGSFSPMFGEVI